MCGEPRVAAECTCTAREFGRCSKVCTNTKMLPGNSDGFLRHDEPARDLYETVVVRMRLHQSTVDFVARRTAGGRTRREIIRCLKRFLAREIYQRVMADFRMRRHVTQAA